MMPRPSLGDTAVDLSGLSDAAAWCRTEGHGWKWLTDEPIADTRGVVVQFERKEICSHCLAEASRIITTRDWSATPRKITRYPDGYLLREHRGRIDRADVFAEQFARADKHTK